MKTKPTQYTNVKKSLQVSLIQGAGSAVLGLALISMAGCCSWGNCSLDNLRGSGFSDEYSGLNKLRNGESLGEKTGFSTKARQIENSLGY